MRSFTFAIILWFVIALPTSALAQGPYFEAGPNTVTVSDDVWIDEARDRSIPVKLYTPEVEHAPPVVIFSHGLGGDRDGAAYLGQHMSSWGFLSVHIQHPGSDADVWAGLRRRPAIMAALAKAANDPSVAIARYTDIGFVLDTLEARKTQGDIKADLDRIGVYGHSFGAHTVLAAAGFRYITSDGVVSFKAPEIKAGVALSPPAPNARIAVEDRPRTYADISIPLLHVTGTEDAQPFNPDIDPSDRQVPFSMIGPEPQYLIVFDGGDHGVFSGRESRRPDPDWYPRVQAQTAHATVAFFLAYLTGDDAAMAFMNGDTFEAAFDADATVKRRNIPSDHMPE